MLHEHTLIQWAVLQLDANGNILNDNMFRMNSSSDYISRSAKVGPACSQSCSDSLVYQPPPTTGHMAPHCMQTQGCIVQMPCIMLSPQMDDHVCCVERSSTPATSWSALPSHPRARQGLLNHHTCLPCKIATSCSTGMAVGSPASVKPSAA